MSPAYHAVSPQQADCEGTSGGNFSGISRKHLSNQLLGLQCDSNPWSHFILYFNNIGVISCLNSRQCAPSNRALLMLVRRGRARWSCRSQDRRCQTEFTPVPALTGGIVAL